MRALLRRLRPAIRMARAQRRTNLQVRSLPIGLGGNVFAIASPVQRFCSGGEFDPDSVRSWATDEDIQEADKWAENFSITDLPKEKFNVSFSRSGGAGGQNVNKVNTKAEVRFNVSSARAWFPAYVVKRLVEAEARRVNRRGEFVVASTRHRTQEQNVQDCYGKLFRMLMRAAATPTRPTAEKQAKIKDLQKKAQAARRKRKERQSDKKGSRRDRKRGDFHKL